MNACVCYICVEGATELCPQVLQRRELVHRLQRPIRHAHKRKGATEGQRNVLARKLSRPSKKDHAARAAKAAEEAEEEAKQDAVEEKTEGTPQTSCDAAFGGIW